MRTGTREVGMKSLPARQYLNTILSYDPKAIANAIAATAGANET